jgi:hypothetical protein
MFVKEFEKKFEYKRLSKIGKEHTYYRSRTIVELKCDNCNEIFHRDKGKIDPRRLNNNFFHVCSHCDSKRFAQKRGVDRKRVWDLPASSSLPISRL